MSRVTRDRAGSPALAAAGLVQIAAAAATGWPLAAVTAQPELLERVGVTSIRRLRQCHVDLIMMGGLVTAAGAASDPPPWASTAVVVGAWTNPLLFLPLAVDPTLTNRKGYQAASVASFLVTSLGWAGVALSAVRRLRH